MKKKKKTIDNVIWNFIDEHIDLIYLILITVLAIAIRVILLKYTSHDYNGFLKPWFDQLKGAGGLPGLAYNIGDYSPPYITILALLTYLPMNSLESIKMVSILFDFISAIAIYKIAGELLKKNKNGNSIALLFYAIALFLPTVILNSAYWAQCDGIYTSFILISIYYLMRKDYGRSLIIFGIALAFKLQAIFLLPLYVLMYISERKIKIHQFLYIPLVMFLLSIPKIIFSGDFLSAFRPYFGQVDLYNGYITLNFPNIYSLFLNNAPSDGSNLIYTPFDNYKYIGIIIIFIILVTLAYFVRVKKIKFDNKAIIEFAILSMLLTTFLLPQMHERYLYAGDIICILYLLVDKKKYYLPIGVSLISLYGYNWYLFGGKAMPMAYVSILFMIIIIIYSRDIIKKYFITSKE